MTQAAMFAGPLEQAFQEFHRMYPEVYDYLVEYTRNYRLNRGPNAKVGIKTVFERVRWEIELQHLKGTPKLNNNHTAFYARLIMAQEADLQGVFDLRSQKVAATFSPMRGAA